jgi:hypothetical protein
MQNILIKTIFLLFLISGCCQDRVSFYSKKCLSNNISNNCLSFYKGYELPQYQVQTTTNEKIEIRYYQSIIVAEVKAIGTRKQAVKKGFRILASYIFGNNINKTKIDMTSPVNQIKQSKNEWLVQFGMPHYFTLDNLPKPKNSDINFRLLPQKKTAVIIFSGIWSDEKFNFYLQELKKYLIDNNLSTLSEPIFSYYDDPFTFPWNRKNEIIWQIQEK